LRHDLLRRLFTFRQPLAAIRDYRRAKGLEMPELMQNLIELSAILDRIAQPLPNDEETQDETGNLWDEFEPIDGKTYI
jgi:hypothetical protein